MKKYIHTALKGTLTALLLMVGVSTWAEEPETNVAQIGETPYATLQDAIDAATDGQTVTLIADISATETYTINKTITIDFGTCTITGDHTNNKDKMFAITSTGDLTITGTGSIQDNDVRGIFYNEGKLTINSGTFTTTNNDGFAVIYNTGSTANCTVNGGTFTGAYAAVYNVSGATMTVTGGKFSAPDYGMAIKSGATLNVNAGSSEISSTNSTGAGINVVDANTTATISGGTITGHNGVFIMTNAKLIVNDGATITGSNASITGRGNAGEGNTSITINGGTMTSEDTGIYHPQVGTLTINDGTITGGKLGVEIRAGVLSVTGGSIKANATEYSCTPNGNGTTTVGAALAIAQHTTKQNISVTISGGEFTGVKAISESNPQENEPDPQVTMSVTEGEFHGGITVTDVQGGFIAGGTYSEVFPAEYCVEGKAPYVDENGACTIITPETEVPTDAEALSNGIYYKVLGNAITAAGNTATTISVLKDPVAASITIPASADITLSIADEVELKKPITNSGALTISSGTISGDITINNADGTVKIANEVTSTSVVAISTELQTENVLKTSTTKESGYTSYWVEKKVKATVSKEISEAVKTYAQALAENTAITDISLPENHSLTITVTSVTLDDSKVTEATFDVKLIGADGQEKTEAESAVTFRLPISSSVATDTWVNLWHKSTAIHGANVQGSDENKFVAIATTSFSPFSYEIIENPIAQIGETKFGTVAAAIDKATATETEIKLLDNVSEDISVGEGKNVKFTIGSLTVSGAITNEGTLTIADGTIEGTSKTITNTGVLTISGGNISNPVSASAGSLAISGGTISNTITTSGDAALTISNGTITGALTVGCSGTNAISGGTISGALTTNAATTISGGEITSNITNSAALTITGGTFTGTLTNTDPGTVAISGGTHTQRPVADFCDTGYIPIKNEAGKYNMTNHWTITDATVIDGSHFEYLTSIAGYKVTTATYFRNTGMVSAGNAETKYGTICLPFDIKAQPAGMKLYTATTISGNTLTITEVTDFSSAISAGTPLIFELNAVASNMTVTSTNDGGIAVNTTAPGASPVSGNLLVGTFAGTVLNSESIPVLSDKIYYLNGDKFHQAKVSLTVPAYRAYIHYQAPTPSPAPSMLSIVKEGDEETAIQQIEALETVTEVYDLNGRKLNGLQRGVNIMRRADGSIFKVIVK